MPAFGDPYTRMGDEFELSVAHFVAARGSVLLPEFALVVFEPNDRVSQGATHAGRPHIYRVTASTMARRLDLLGFSLPGARREFCRGVASLREGERCTWPERLLGSTGFDDWLEGMRGAIDAARRLEHIMVDETEDERLRFMLSADDQMFGFPSLSPEFLLRAILAAAQPNDEVALDFDDLVAAGYVKDDDSLWDVEGRSPLIVVTEGKSDARVLRDSLRLLHPALARFFTFIDFETANARGGTAELVQFVRMFIGCGIRNRILVVFDNDAAGHEALQAVRETDIPPNVFAMTLPALERARTYPTLGPDGPASSDVNGRACALELYLGDDVLIGPDGERLPVRWTGFNDKMRRYQGEITDKRGVQKRFQEKLEAAGSGNSISALAVGDFSGLLTVFDAIFSTVGEY